MKTCPECQKPQPEDEPFCQNCGFRLASHKTAMEGLPAIAASMGRPAPTRRAVTQEEQVLPPELLISQTPPTQPEGLHPVRALFEEHTDVESAASTPHDPLESQPLLALSPASLTPATSPWPLVVAAGIGVLFGGAIASFFLAKDQETSDLQAPKAPRPAATISLPAGTLLQGLDESTRSFILQACFKVADDPDTECDQDVLLAGEWPQKSVALPAFSIDAGEVTQAAYDVCVGQQKCAPVALKGCRVYTIQGYQVALRVPKAMIDPDLPAVCVTHAQAAAYCAFAGGALPSHEQWERAARGQDRAPMFPWGDTWEPGIANWGERDVFKTVIAGKVDGSAWSAPSGAYPDSDTKEGVRDMAGNVAEWVLSPDQNQGIVRGGSWTSSPFDLRVTKRAHVPQEHARTDVGFRCAYAP